MEGNPVAVACADVIAFLRGEGIYEHETAHMRDLNNHGEVCPCCAIVQECVEPYASYFLCRLVVAS